MENEELINKYFLEELSSKELEQFQVLLEEDAEFKEQFQFEKEVRKVIVSKERSKLKSKLQELEEELEPPEAIRRFPWRPLSIAASIMVLIGLGWFMLKPDRTDLQGLYSSNYDIYPNTVFTITRGDSINTLERRAFVAYESGEFEKAINLFEELSVPDKKDYLDFYLGQSFLQLEKTDKAAQSFLLAIKSNSEFVSESRWYLALTYLKMEDTIKAKLTLEELIEAGDFRKEAAEQLLSELP
ncbi:tetratricopeptide repeat protein [Muriicola sp. Z0-33]|uniref:tetratricopeptide repeat protein n=1 Tax=Muriicola sp. Z0-33 TaxID=2816957 RepID=UPI0022386D0B|nr:tetratricopeptide repeat protein [Muriicola sp. Z0-33]MCW5516891.1 hypothetical protein [Muriicola sp. Z0-33]